MCVCEYACHCMCQSSGKKFNEATGTLTPYHPFPHYHGDCEDGRREELELGLIISLENGIDEITESCHHGNSQQHLEGEIHV